jgi:hypothetical protein
MADKGRIAFGLAESAFEGGPESNRVLVSCTRNPDSSGPQRNRWSARSAVVVIPAIALAARQCRTSKNARAGRQDSTAEARMPQRRRHFVPLLLAALHGVHGPRQSSALALTLASDHVRAAEYLDLSNDAFRNGG